MRLLGWSCAACLSSASAFSTSSGEAPSQSTTTLTLRSEGRQCNPRLRQLPFPSLYRALTGTRNSRCWRFGITVGGTDLLEDSSSVLEPKAARAPCCFPFQRLNETQAESSLTTNCTIQLENLQCRNFWKKPSPAITTVAVEPDDDKYGRGL